jgi:hypothetical protein
VQIGPAPQPAPVIQNNITVAAPPPDPQAIAEASVQSSQAILVTVVAPPPIEWANDMLNLPDMWRTTPPGLTYDHPAIQDLVRQMTDHAWALVALAIFVTGLSIALARSSGYGGRVVFAVVAAMGTLIWWRIGIDLNNMICAAIGAPDLPSIVRPRLTATFDASEHVGTVILTVVYAIVTLMLMFSLVVRLVLIDVLIVAGPLFLMCFATPQSESLASKYVGLSVGLLFSQVLIVVGLKLVSAFSMGEGVGATLLSIAVLLSLRRLPGLLSSLSQQQPQGATVVQRVVTRNVVRRLSPR